MTTLSPELKWMTLTAALAAVLWMPYFLNRVREVNITGALFNGAKPAPALAAWAERARAAHDNAVVALAIFAPLALAIHITQAGTPQTATAAAVFFFARVVHAVVYPLGLPFIRSVAFTIGTGCQLFLASRLLM